MYFVTYLTWIDITCWRFMSINLGLNIPGFMIHNANVSVRRVKLKGKLNSLIKYTIIFALLLLYQILYQPL